MVHENSLKNLKPFQDRDKRELSEISRKGQEAGIEVKRKKKTLRELIEILGSQPATENELSMFQKQFPGIDVSEITKDMMLLASAYNQAIGRGNTKAMSFLRDTKGEKPETVISGSVTTEKIFITPEQQQQTLDHIAEVIADGSGSGN